MTRSRALLVVAVLLGALVTGVAGAAAASSPRLASCSDSWKSPVSGVWGAGANWSTGVIPSNADNVCITVPGTYTVTLAPWSLGTADPNNNGASVNSLTLGLGGGAGTQTLDIAGQGSTSNSNEQLSTVFLNVVTTSTIAARGALVLDSTDGGSQLPGNPIGGDAVLSGAPVLNYGSVTAEIQDAKNKYANTTQIEAPLTNEAGASLQDGSGTLEVAAITNYGTFTVAPRAELSVVNLEGFASPSSFTNDGELVNDGSILAQQGSGPLTWTQAGGYVKGNVVTLQSGATLVDKAGAAQFLVNYLGANIKGTIPAVQKITVVGGAYNYQGDNYNVTALGLDHSSVVNQGTLVLVTQGSGKKTGGAVTVSDGSIDNKGTILAEIKDPSWNVQYEAGLTNTHTGNLTVTGGTFTDGGGAPVTNHGTVTVGPRALFLLQEASAFMNKSDGTIVSEISSTKSLGQFELVSPCCAGPGRFIAGGTLAPVLKSGHAPAANTDFQLFLLSGGSFKGTFAHLGRRFTADYAHESASPAFVGAVYDKSGKKPKG